MLENVWRTRFLFHSHFGWDSSDLVKTDLEGRYLPLSVVSRGPASPGAEGPLCGLDAHTEELKDALEMPVSLH